MEENLKQSKDKDVQDLELDNLKGGTGDIFTIRKTLG